MISIVDCVMLVLVLMIAPDRPPAPEQRDRSVIGVIVSEIQQFSTLYARDDKPGIPWPIFKRERLAELRIDDRDSYEKELARYQKNPQAYEIAHPGRAAIFEASAEMEDLRKLKTPMTLRAADLPKVLFRQGRMLYPVEIPYASIGGTPYLLSQTYDSKTSREKAKALVALLTRQEPAAEAIFKLEQLLPRIPPLEETGLQDNDEMPIVIRKEPSPRWRAHHLWTRARLLSDLMFLYEYNYAWGRVRMDDLPDLEAKYDGWWMARRERMQIRDAKPMNYVRDRTRTLRQLKGDYAGTPWAFFADRELDRPVGMQWEPRKK